MAETSFSGENTAEMPSSSGSGGRSRPSEVEAGQDGVSSSSSTCRHLSKSDDHRAMTGENGFDDEVAMATETNNTSAGDSRFACNICLEAVVEPVVTPCGHLYCWPCLYRWLEPGLRPDELRFIFHGHDEPVVETHRQNLGRRCCPVCKKECGVRTLIPIYVRNDDQPPLGHRRRRTGMGFVGEARDVGSTGDVPHDDAAAASLGLRRRRPGGRNPNNDGAHGSFSDVSGQHVDFGEDHATGDAEYPATPEPSGEVPVRAGGIDDSSSAAAVPSRPLPPPAPSSPQSPTTTTTASVRDLSLPERTRTHDRSTSTSSSSSPRSSFHHGPLFQALLGLHHDRGDRHRAPPRPTPPTDHHTGDDSSSEGGEGRGDDPLSHHWTGNATVEDATTEFLSRLLLMLGSFVVLCLLLF